MFTPRCPLCRPHFRPPCLGDLHSSATEMATPPTVPVRQDYHADCEAAVNRLINLELHASYVYLSMAVYFNREDVALKNTAEFFLHQSRKEREKADGLMELQHQRGGRPNVREIKLERDEWASSREAMESAMLLAERVNQCLLDLHRLAVEKQDPYLCDFLQRHCLHEQVKFIRELGGHITTLQKMGVPGSGLAEYLFDKLTLGDGKN